MRVNERIQTAVEECVRRCERSQAPMVCVAEFLLKLRDVDQWTPEEANEVGRWAIRLIREQPGARG